MKNNGAIGYTNGIRNENEIIRAINKKKFSELTPHLKMVVETMFPHIKDNNIIEVSHVDGFAKPDLKFVVDDEEHFLSVKFGMSSQVHCEDLTIFLDWLKRHNIPEYILNCIRKYHYADGTLDGTGKERLSQNRAMIVYEQEIKDINEALNEDRFFVRDLARRVVFDGNDPLKPSADFLYHGDIEEGEICSMESVLRYCKNKRADSIIMPHIGRIMIRPYARYLSGQDTHPEKRHKVVFEWVRMNWDLQYIKQWGY